MTDEEAEESIMAVDNDGNGEVITFTLISYPMQGLFYRGKILNFVHTNI